MSITQSECLFVALRIQHATRVRHVVNFNLPRCTNVFHIISQTARFSNMLLNIKCVFHISLQCLSETFFIRRRTERDIIKKIYIGLHVNLYSCPILMILKFTWQIFRKILKYQISPKIHPARAELFHADGRTDGKIDRQTDDEANSCSSRFCERT
jgi:hypothetical protein